MFPLIALTMAYPSQKEEHLCHFHVRASLMSFDMRKHGEGTNLV